VSFKLPTKIKVPVLTIYRLDLPNGFSYGVSVGENGDVHGSYTVTMGYFSFSQGVKFDKNYDAKMRVFDFLNNRQR